MSENEMSEAAHGENVEIKTQKMRPDEMHMSFQ